MKAGDAYAGSKALGLSQGQDGGVAKDLAAGNASLVPEGRTGALSKMGVVVAMDVAQNDEVLHRHIFHGKGFVAALKRAFCAGSLASLLQKQTGDGILNSLLGVILYVNDDVNWGGGTYTSTNTDTLADLQRSTFQFAAGALGDGVVGL